MATNPRHGVVDEWGQRLWLPWPVRGGWVGDARAGRGEPIAHHRRARRSLRRRHHRRKDRLNPWRRRRTDRPPGCGSPRRWAGTWRSVRSSFERGPRAGPRHRHRADVPPDDRDARRSARSSPTRATRPTATGWVRCEALGGKRPVEQGRFNLFVETERPRRAAMLYRLHFTRRRRHTPDARRPQGDRRRPRLRPVARHDDAVHAAAQRPRRAGRRRRRATSSRRGSCGSPRSSFARQLTTFRASGRGLAGNLAALMRFDALFLGELWRVYGKPRRRGIASMSAAPRTAHVGHPGPRRIVDQRGRRADRRRGRAGLAPRQAPADPWRRARRPHRGARVPLSAAADRVRGLQGQLDAREHDLEHGRVVRHDVRDHPGDHARDPRPGWARPDPQPRRRAAATSITSSRARCSPGERRRRHQPVPRAPQPLAGDPVRRRRRARPRRGRAAARAR